MTLIALALVASTMEEERLRGVVEEVYASGEFGREEQRILWRPIDDEEDDVIDPPRLNIRLGPVVAVLLGGVGLALLVALAMNLWKQRRDDDVAAAQAANASLPTTLFGLDVRPESLPADVLGAAMWSWGRGDPEKALGLLYRAALALVVRRGTEVPVSATEGECVERVIKKLGAGLGADFATLTLAWQLTSYGRRPPVDSEFHALLARWRPHFGGPA